MPDELKFNIKVDGDAASAERINRVTSAVDKSSRASKGNAAANKQAASTLDALGASGGPVNDAFEGITRAARGGENAVIGLAKAWRGLSAAFISNPITAVLAGTLATLPLIRKGFDLLGASISKAFFAIEEGGTRTTDLRNRFAELDAAAAKANREMTDGAKQSTAEYTRLAAAISTSASQHDALRAAQQKLEIARLREAEANELAGATNDDQRDAIKQRYEIARAALETDSEDVRLKEQALYLEEQLATAQAARRAALEQLSAAQQRAGLSATVATRTEQRALAARAEGSPLADTYRDAAFAARRTANIDAAALKTLRESLAPVLQSTADRIGTTENTLQINQLQQQELGLRRNSGLTGLQTDAAADIAPRAARDVLGRIRAPRDLNADEETSVFQRATAINRNALAQEGRQAGETMGEAVALALREIFPQLTAAYQRIVATELDRAIKQETTRLEQQIKALRR